MNPPQIITGADGKVWVITGSPFSGYVINAVTLEPLPGRFQSAWQAKVALEQRTGGPAT